MTGRLEGKVAVITGGSSGIGRATAELFVAEGACVVVADIQESKGVELERTHGERLRFIRCDVSVEADIEAAVALAVRAWGRLDVMFNNAATSGTPLLIEDMSVEAWDESHVLILRSVMLGCKHAARVMGRQSTGGSIVNMSSAAAIVPFGRGRGPSYGVMKAGVAYLSKALAAELGSKRIRVNAVQPGYVATSIIGITAGATIEVADRMAGRLDEIFGDLQPMPRGGSPGDIAEAVLFLSSDAATWITGINLPIDGGFTVNYRSDLSASLPHLRGQVEEELERERRYGGG